MSFTPGPWKIKQGSRWGEYMIYAPQKKAGRQVEQPVAFTVDHNARLIAAAPEMYECLKEFINAVDTARDFSRLLDTYVKANALLRRIEGDDLE